MPCIHVLTEDGGDMFFKMLVTIHKSMWYHNTENHNIWTISTAGYKQRTLYININSDKNYFIPLF